VSSARGPALATSPQAGQAMADQAAATPVQQVVSGARGSVAATPGVQRMQSAGEPLPGSARLNAFAVTASPASLTAPVAPAAVIKPPAVVPAVPTATIPVRRSSVQGGGCASTLVTQVVSLASIQQGAESPKKKVGFTGRDSVQAVPQMDQSQMNLTAEALQRLTGQDTLPARRRSSAYTQRSSIAGSEFWEDDTMDEVQNRACTKLEKKLVAKGLR